MENLTPDDLNNVVDLWKYVVDNEIPVFTKDREYIMKRLEDDFTEESE